MVWLRPPLIKKYCLIVGIIVGAALFTKATIFPGSLVSPDSISYISAAEHLAHDGSFTLYSGQPLVYWTPLTSTMLAPIFLFRGDLFFSASLLYSFFFGLLAYVTFLIIRELVHDMWWSLGTVLVLVVWRPALFSYTYIWSEALFLVLCAVSLLAFFKWQRTSAREWFAVMTVMSGGAALARYSGIFVIFSICIAIALLSGRTWYKKIRLGVLYAVVSSVPIGFWLLRNATVVGSSSGRSFGYLSPSLSIFSDLLSVGLGHFLNWGYSTAGQIITGIIIIGIILWYNLIRNNVPHMTRQRYLPLYSIMVVYIVFLTVTIAFIDRTIEFDLRQMGLVLYCGLVILSWYCYSIYTRIKSHTLIRWVHGAGIVVSIFFIMGWAVFVEEMFQRRVSQSLTIAYLQSLSSRFETKKLYSNIPDYIYLATGRPAYFIPKRFNAMRSIPNQNFEVEYGILLNDLQNDDAIIVLGGSERVYLMQEEELRAIRGMTIVYDDGHVVIMKLAEDVRDSR